MQVNHETATEALRHYQNPSKESGAFVLDFLKSVQTLFAKTPDGFTPADPDIQAAARRGFYGADG